MKLGNGRNSVGNRFIRKNFRLKDGDQVYRILPGLGELADSNRWNVHYAVHWGYKATDGKRKPFASPEQRNRKTNMVEVPDAAKERLESLKAKLQEAKVSGNKATYEKLNALVGHQGLYNLDKNYHLNVIDLQGNIGVLQLRHKCMVALKSKIDKLESSGVYPLSPTDGRYFVFTRTGMGNDTAFAVSVLQEEFEVQGVGKVKRDISHSLNDEIISRLSNEAGKLNQLFPRPTSEQVKSIVDSSDLLTGVSPYLDELFGKRTPLDSQDDGDDSSQVTAATVSAGANMAATTAAVAKTEETTVSVPAAVQKAAVSVTDLDNDTFLEMLKNGTL